MQKIRELRKDFPIIPYNASRHSDGDGGMMRPTLSVSWDKGDRRVVAIGINPSVATDGQSDMTITKLCRFLDMYGYNHIFMLNLFESAATQQGNINRRTDTDFNAYRVEFDEAEIILLCWGRTRKYLKQLLAAKDVLLDYRNKIYCVGFTDIKTEKLHCPLHPSRMPYYAELMKYNIELIK